MQAWQRLDETETEKMGFRVVVHKNFRRNNGDTFKASIVGKDGNEAAIAIALTPDNKVIVARQFRCGPEKILDEMPGGLIDPGETPEHAIRREMAEEIGYASDEITYIGKSYVNAWDNTTHHYFLAKNCYAFPSDNPDNDEEIEIDTISIRQLINNALNAKMTDAQIVLMAYDTLVELEGK